MTSPNRYPIPHVLNFNIKIHSKAILSKFDLLRGFHRIPVAEDDIQRDRMAMPFGLFEYPFMNFGRCNTAQTFQ